MKCSVILDNFNYGQYLARAIDSVLAQTHRDFELLVVDDGSEDESESVLQRYEHMPQVQIIRKPNGGQLSAFQAASPRIGGDVVFFLDADDWYERAYLEQAVLFYKAHETCDFLTVGRYIEGSGIPADRTTKRSTGYSALRTYYLHRWIGGGATSISMRAGVLQRILPIPDETSWRLRADDCLVMGASLVGAKKYYLPDPLVHYFIHGKNGMMGCSDDNDHTYRREIAINRMYEHIVRRNTVFLGHHMLVPEFKSIVEKRWSDVTDYAKVLMLMDIPSAYVIKYCVKLIALYLSEKPTVPH